MTQHLSPVGDNRISMGLTIMRIFRIRFRIAGGHVHCALFSAKTPNQTFAKCGDFVVERGEEFEALMRQFNAAEFIGESADGTVAACRAV